MEKQSIKDWAIDDRPREKMMNKGADSLSDSELLAILINNGTREKSAVELGKELMAKTKNDLSVLGRLSVKEIVGLKIKGLGPAKAISIVAALELGIRRGAAANKKDVVRTSKDIADYLRSRIQYKSHEVFAVVFLNSANKVNHFEVISEGGMTETIADPRIILRKALEHEATRIVLCHNHPSGNLRPSRQDESITQKIKNAASFFNITVLDHIIVSEEGYYSFADEGVL